MNGIAINNRILRINSTTFEFSENYPPGHPKIFQLLKCSLVILPLQIQHQPYPHFEQVMWLHPSIFSVPNPQFGHLRISFSFMYFLNSASPCLLQDEPLCATAPHLKHIFYPHSQVAVYLYPQHPFFLLT